MVIRPLKRRQGLSCARPNFVAEGHNAETEEDARKNLHAQVYEEFYKRRRDTRGNRQKTDKEKFAGAVETYTMEAMHNGVALMRHVAYFGTVCARLTCVYRQERRCATRTRLLGVSTRMMGAIIMVHDDGLVAADSRLSRLLSSPSAFKRRRGTRLWVTTPKQSYRENRLSITRGQIRIEMKGVPLRLEIGPRTLRRALRAGKADNGEKISVSLDNSKTL